MSDKRETVGPSGLSRKDMEIRCREIVEALCAAVGSVAPGLGFTLFIFDVDGGDGQGNIAYVSTAKRADMIVALEDFIARQRTVN